MGRICRLTAALVLVAGLLGTSTANAGPVISYFFPGIGTDSSYSPIHYWAPRVSKVNADIHGPKLSVYATDRHPEIPASTIILKYPHPPVDPAGTLIQPPTAPATSRFKY